MNLPNRLTIFRIILVPIMVIIPYLGIEGDFLNIPIMYWIINLIFCIAAITDKLDGCIARARNQITTFGKFLDPIADKILVLAAMVLLVSFDNKIPAIIPIIVLFREFAVSGYRLIAVEKGGKVIAASVWGKLKTVTQMVAIILSFLDVHKFGEFIFNDVQGAFALGLNIVSTVFMFACVVATILSGWDYIKGGKDLLTSDI